MEQIRHVPDQELLSAYARRGDESAFADVVARHQHLVYAACLRRLQDETLAKDAAQMTFLLLAQKARELCKHVNLAGWLYQTAQFQAANLLRKENRRQRGAVSLEVAPPASAPHPVEMAAQLNEHLDDALLELRDADREAVILHFFSGHTFRRVGEAQGTSEDAARKRVSRALERMADFLRGRHATATSIATLTAVLSAPASAAPAGFTASVLNTVHATQLAVAAGASAALIAKVKLVAIMATLAAVPAVLVWQSNRELRRENERLQARHAVVVESLAAPHFEQTSAFARPGTAIGAVHAPEPNRLFQLLDALLAAESQQRRERKLQAWQQRLGWSAEMREQVERELISAAEAQTAALHALSSGDVQFERIVAFLRAEPMAHGSIEQMLPPEQRETFRALAAQDRRELARDLAMWRLADLQLSLRLSEDQQPALQRALSDSTLSAITELIEPSVTTMEALLARLDAIGARENLAAAQVLTREQLQRFEAQANQRRRALDYLLKPEHQ